VLRLGGFLNALADELEAGNLLAKAGPMMHRWRHGPLLYPKPIDKTAALPDPPVCLAIMLSFLVRRYTLNGDTYYQQGEGYWVGDTYYQQGERYWVKAEKQGRPGWPVVQVFVEDAFNIEDSDHVMAAAKQRIKMNPDLQIFRW
jgi:hypothetical protein